MFNTLIRLGAAMLLRLPSTLYFFLPSFYTGCLNYMRSPKYLPYNKVRLLQGAHIRWEEFFLKVIFQETKLVGYVIEVIKIFLLRIYIFLPFYYIYTLI
jgi:hypothetical protein